MIINPKQKLTSATLTYNKSYTNCTPTTSSRNKSSTNSWAATAPTKPKPSLNVSTTTNSTSSTSSGQDSPSPITDVPLNFWPYSTPISTKSTAFKSSIMLSKAFWSIYIAWLPTAIRSYVPKLTPMSITCSGSSCNSSICTWLKGKLLMIHSGNSFLSKGRPRLECKTIYKFTIRPLGLITYSQLRKSLCSKKQDPKCLTP